MSNRPRPLVTIGVPTFNRPESLRQALEDLLVQTYEEIEILVSDNASHSSDTEDVVRAFMVRDRRVRFFRHDSPMPGADNFLFVLRQATGTYFAWAADDDRREPRFVEDLVAILEADKACSLAYSEAEILDGPVTWTSGVQRSRIETVGLSRLAAIRMVLKEQRLNTEMFGVMRRSAMLDWDRAHFFGADHAWLLHLGLKGAIRKGPAGLLKVRLGGIGSSADGVARAFGLQRTLATRYFGSLLQGMGMARYLMDSPQLSGTQKPFALCMVVERYLLCEYYRQAIVSDLKALVRDALRKAPNVLTGKAEHILKEFDYWRVRWAARQVPRLAWSASAKRKRLALVSLDGMNHFMAVIWSLASIGLRARGYEAVVVTLSTSRENNRYYRLFGLPMVFWDQLLEEFRKSEYWRQQSEPFEEALASCKTFLDFHGFEWDGVPFGKYGISTFCRDHTTGTVDVERPSERSELRRVIELTYLNFVCAKRFVNDRAIDIGFFTELNTHSYGGWYRACLSRGATVIRWASSSRDDAYFLQRFDAEFHSWHHAALAPSTWERVRKQRFTEEADREVDRLFERRYGGEWRVFARNYKDTSAVPAAELRKSLGIASDRRIAVIYSHILYDTLYFYGSDLFVNYADWFVETVRVACANSRLEWFVKIHPSNVWRGERRAGEYEEEVLVRDRIGTLPPHVHVIPPNTPVTPLSWMELADFGITARGTPGLEMACLGKVVLTAGKGRYEGCGFTIDSETKEEYLTRLLSLPDGATLPDGARARARHYMHAVFLQKPLEMWCTETSLRTGKRDLRLFNDLLVLPSRHLAGVRPENWPDVAQLAAWLDRPDERDYMRP